MRPNRRYKDQLFRFLFQNKKDLHAFEKGRGSGCLECKAVMLNMLLTEYDEELHMKNVYQDGYEEGEQAGEQKLLERQVRKKLERGKNAAEIAEDLEIKITAAEELITGIENQKNS